MSHPDYEIVNIIADFRLRSTVDLPALAMHSDVTYEPERSSSATIKLAKGGTGIIQKSGRVILTGLRNSGDVEAAQAQLLLLLGRWGLNPGTPVLRYLNHVVVCSAKSRVELRKLVMLDEGIEYEPETFPAAIQRFDSTRAVVMYYSTGKIVITGVKNEAGVAEMVEAALKLAHSAAH